MEINTIRYIFGAKKPELRRLVVKYGLPPAKNEQDLWHKTNYLVAKFQEEMLKDIAYIHPDRELILWSTDESKGKNEEKSASATSNFEGNEQAVMQPQPQPQPQAQPQQQQEQVVPQVVVEKIQAGSFQETLKNNMPLVVVGSLLLVGGLILFGNRKIS
jgi:hypothetical protein